MEPASLQDPAQISSDHLGNLKAHVQGSEPPAINTYLFLTMVSQGGETWLE